MGAGLWEVFLVPYDVTSHWEGMDWEEGTHQETKFVTLSDFDLTLEVIFEFTWGFDQGLQQFLKADELMGLFSDLPENNPNAHVNLRFNVIITVSPHPNSLEMIPDI